VCTDCGYVLDNFIYVNDFQQQQQQQEEEENISSYKPHLASELLRDIGDRHFIVMKIVNHAIFLYEDYTMKLQREKDKGNSIPKATLPQLAAFSLFASCVYFDSHFMPANLQQFFDEPIIDVVFELAKYFHLDLSNLNIGAVCNHICRQIPYISYSIKELAVRICTSANLCIRNKCRMNTIVAVILHVFNARHVIRLRDNDFKRFTGISVSYVKRLIQKNPDVIDEIIIHLPPPYTTDNDDE